MSFNLSLFDDWNYFQGESFKTFNGTGLSSDDRKAVFKKLAASWANHCEAEAFSENMLNRGKFTLLRWQYQSFSAISCKNIFNSKAFNEACALDFLRLFDPYEKRFFPKVYEAIDKHSLDEQIKPSLSASLFEYLSSTENTSKVFGFGDVRQAMHDTLLHGRDCAEVEKIPTAKNTYKSLLHVLRTAGLLLEMDREDKYGFKMWMQGVAPPPPDHPLPHGAEQLLRKKNLTNKSNDRSRGAVSPTLQFTRGTSGSCRHKRNM